MECRGTAYVGTLEDDLGETTFVFRDARRTTVLGAWDAANPPLCQRPIERLYAASAGPCGNGRDAEGGCTRRVVPAGIGAGVVAPPSAAPV